MSVRHKDRALFYGRRSGEQQEQSLENQLTWAINQAATDDVSLDVNLETLKEAQANRLSNVGVLFIDDAVTGSKANRPGITALFQTALIDRSVSHIYVYKRDRLHRPDDPAGAVSQENRLLRAGITLVFVDGDAKPREDGRTDMAGQIMALLDYHKSGEFLVDLSQRILGSKQALANAGFSAGGRPPYGFGRFLKHPDGKLDPLADGMRVRMDGCHVVHLPSDEEKIAVWLSILEMKYRGLGIQAIAEELNHRGIPSPDSGRTRTDQGVRHLVSGKWNQSTINELCRNPIIIGRLEYGKRSEGKHLRHTKSGSRSLRGDERRGEDAVRRVKNPREERLVTIAGFDPLYPPDRWEKIQEQMDKRSRTQAGIPKNRDPGKYPLSTIVVDLTEGCGSLMYGNQRKKRIDGQTCCDPVYTCGRYVKERDCYHNWVDGERLLEVVLRSLKHAISHSGSRQRLTEKLLEMSGQSAEGNEERRRDADRLRAEAGQIEASAREVARKLAVESDKALAGVFREEFQRLHQRAAETRKQIEGLESAERLPDSTPEKKAKKALQLLDRLEVLATVPEARGQINALLKKLQVWVGLEFHGVQWGKREVRRLRRGAISIGGYHLSVPLHGRDNLENKTPAGDSGRSTGLQLVADDSAATPGGSSGAIVGKTAETDEEGASCTKVSRGD